MKAYLEIVEIKDDVVTVSGGAVNECPCYDAMTPGSELCPTDE